MKEREFSKIEQERNTCKNEFLGLKNIFENIVNLLNMKISNNKGLDLCRNPEVYITKRRKDLLKESLISITNLKEPINAKVKWTAFKSNTTRDIGSISKAMHGSINSDNLSEVVKYVKIIYKRVHDFPENIDFEGYTGGDLKNKFEIFLKYILNVLKLEKQELLDKKSIHDSIIGTDSKGSYQFDAKLRKQIDNIFDANSTWKPELKDIKQGQLADCSLLSALLSIIKTDPNAIRKCFFGQTKNTIKFRFFKVKIDIKPQKGLKPSGYKASPNGKIIIEVQKSILKDFENKIIGNSTDALWVNMFEKAFTVYKATDEYVISTDSYCQTNIIDKWKNTTSGSISISNLEWGYGFIFLTAITGRCAVSRNIPTIKGKKFPDLKSKVNSSDPDERNYDKSAEDLYNFFDKTLKANKAIVVCSRDDKFESWFKKFPDKTRDYSSPKNHPGLVKMHSYAMVDSVMEDGEHYKYVILQNPHMENPAGYRVNKSFKIKKVKLSSSKSSIQRQENPKYQNLSNGQLKIELNDFIKYFVSYDICSKTKDKT